MRKIILILITLFILTACGSVETPAPTLTSTSKPTDTATPEPTSTPTVEPTATEIPQPTPTPTSQLASYDEFITYIENLYTLVTNSYDADALPLKSIGFIENPDDDITLLVQVKGDISESSKGSTFGILAAVIAKQLNDSPNKVPERLRLFVIEFFDSNDNYFTNYGIKWSDLRELINRNFDGDFLFKVVRTDIKNYKK